MMVCMAGLQVFIVRFFFQVSRPICIELVTRIVTNICLREQEKDTCELLAGSRCVYRKHGMASPGESEFL